MGRYRKRENPEFLCMGFQKSGTTTLFAILKQHKDIVLCRDVKEPMYYRIPILWMIGWNWYYRYRYFAPLLKGDGRHLGEVNAGLTFTNCAKKLRRDFSPETKLIFMMRNPVDRAYSAYKYFLARDFLPKGWVEKDQRLGHAAAFDEYVHSVLDDPAQEGEIMKARLKYLVFSQSRYYTCIAEQLAHFPRENVHLVLFEEFIKDQKGQTEEILDFLQIPADPKVDYTVRANEGSERAVSSRWAHALKVAKGWKFGLYEFLFISHWCPWLYKRFMKFYNWMRKKTFVKDEDKSKMLPATRKYLEEYFAKEVHGVEELMGRSLRDVWY